MKEVSITKHTTLKTLSFAAVCAMTIWLLLWLDAGPASALDAAENTNADPAFRTDARFAVGDEAHTTVSALAWIQERPAWGAGYYWLKVGFYPFELTKQQTGAAATGNYQPIEDKITEDYYSINYASYVRIILSVDEEKQVLQVDMSLPGYGCPIAHLQPDLEEFLQIYEFEGERLRLKSKGSFLCFADVPNIPDKTFQWDLDVDLPVFELID